MDTQNMAPTITPGAPQQKNNIAGGIIIAIVICVIFTAPFLIVGGIVFYGL